MKYLIFLLISVAFFALWWGVKAMNTSLKTRGHFRNKNFIPLVAVSFIILWLYFALWYFLSANSAYPSTILILSLTLVIPTAIYFSKDLIAGLIFQINGKISKGAQLNTENGTYQVIKAGYNGLLVRNDKNAITRVLFSDLKVIESNIQESAFQDENLISVDLILDETNEKAIMKRLNHLIFNNPWVKAGVNPSIAIKLKTGRSEVKISLELISSNYQERFEKHLNEGFLA